MEKLKTKIIELAEILPLISKKKLMAEKKL
jgi:hypothetical protein